MKISIFDKRSDISAQVGAILGLVFAASWLGDMYMMWRLITGCSFVMLVATALQCNQHCEKISGSQCETLIKIAVIIVRLQLWFCGFPQHLSSRGGTRTNQNRQYRSASAPAHTLRGCTHVRVPTSDHTCAYMHKNNREDSTQGLHTYGKISALLSISVK